MFAYRGVSFQRKALTANAILCSLVVVVSMAYAATDGDIEKLAALAMPAPKPPPPPLLLSPTGYTPIQQILRPERDGHTKWSVTTPDIDSYLFIESPVETRVTLGALLALQWTIPPTGGFCVDNASNAADFRSNTISVRSPIKHNASVRLLYIEKSRMLPTPTDRTVRVEIPNDKWSDPRCIPPEVTWRSEATCEVKYLINEWFECKAWSDWR